jgi:DNA-binding transcriptional ArsR family regulator
MLPRLTKQLRKLAVGRAILFGRTEVDGNDLEFIRRVAIDTLPLNRARILEALCTPGTAEEIGQRVRLPPSTVYRHLEDLEALDLVSGDSGKPRLFHLWGAAAVVVTPHTRGKTAESHFPKGVGGDLATQPGEPGSWQEPGGGP